MQPVKCKLIIDIETDQQEANKTKGEANYIESGVQFIPPKISPSDFKIIFDHTVVIYWLIIHGSDNAWPE